MKDLSMHTRALSCLVGSLSLLVAAGCAEPPAPSAPRTVTSPETPTAIASVGDDLGRLRGAVAQFHNIEPPYRHSTLSSPVAWLILGGPVEWAFTTPSRTRSMA